MFLAFKPGGYRKLSPSKISSQTKIKKKNKKIIRIKDNFLYTSEHMPNCIHWWDVWATVTNYDDRESSCRTLISCMQNLSLCSQLQAKSAYCIPIWKGW